MMKYLLFLFVFFIFSCEEKQEKKEDTPTETAFLRKVVKHKEFENVLPLFLPEIETWNEYKTLASFLDRFKKASPKEVLSNAVELNDLTKIFKESLKPEIFNNPSFETRINILYNETLRLVDMNTIPAITAKEVNTQVDKIIDAFSALNSKINTTFSKKKFEDEITIDLSLVGLDTTKIDTISKNTILKRMEEKAQKKQNQ